MRGPGPGRVRLGGERAPRGPQNHGAWPPPSRGAPAFTRKHTPCLAHAAVQIRQLWNSGGRQVDGAAWRAVALAIAGAAVLELGGAAPPTAGDAWALVPMGTLGKLLAFLSDTMYLLISFRMSTPPQNRQLNILIGNSKQYVDDFVGELTF